MQKIKLNLENLSVESFETSAFENEQGTVMAHARTANRGNACDSALDACPTGFCAPTMTCDTYDPELCPSVVDACPSGRGCTEIDCAF